MHEQKLSLAQLCHYSQTRRHLERSERSPKSWFVPAFVDLSLRSR